MADQEPSMSSKVAGFEATHPVWAKSFPETDREQMMSEDSLTWKHVITLLVAVVLTGVTMMGLTVLWVVSLGD